MNDVKRPAAEPEGLLARWSARKARVREAEQALEDQARDASASAPEPSESQERAQSDIEARAEDRPAEEPELTDVDMPPIESLDERSDLSMFFSSKVSTELRRRALRKVFLSAAFNRVDGLDDYAEDFTSFEQLGNIVTSDLKHQMEVARKRLAAAEEQLEQIEGESPDTEVAADAETPGEDVDAADEPKDRADQGAEQAKVRDEEGESKV
jgi:predicted metal-dependent hydrolase